ncbi:MAG: helix-turn-helix domain-containing protein [Actinomycetota bacterium]|nr:helix-turn-helix domain-containing protein [Actinomycetota bacterium]
MVSYNQRVGERLRSIRRQRGFSLQDVQRASDGEFKAAVLGAYERGERSLSVPRLHRLAGYYGVPVVQLLPPEAVAVTTDPTGEKLTIDLGRLDRLDGPVGEILERFLASIQVERQDFNGEVLTVRADDLRLLSRLLGDGGTFSERLDEVRVANRP